MLGENAIERTPNKATSAAREVISRFLDNNIDRLQDWLDEIYKTEGPLAAFRCFTDVIEYHIPKLQRTDMSANVHSKGERLMRISFVTPKTGKEQ